MLHLRFSLRHFLPCEILVLRRSHLRIRKKVCKDSIRYGSHKHFLTQAVTGVSENVSAEQHPEDILFSGAQDTLIGFISGRKKATEVTHLVWKNVIQKGDTVVDATCGNGHDTLALLKMVANESDGGSVYAIDIQNSALEATSSLLDRLVDQNKRKYVRLFNLCHSRMEEILPVGASVRLVAFNLGYLPGGNKAITTLPGTTLLALKAATRVVETGGLISVMVYVGHPGGREELETVQDFASSLTSETWVSFKFEMLNRPLCPVLILLYRKT